MKRFLLASAALTLFSLTGAPGAQAQSVTLQKICNPSLGIPCPPSTDRKDQPRVKAAPRVVVTPNTSVKPRVVVTPQVRVKPEVKPVPPKRVVQTPPKIVVTPPRTKAPKVVVTPPPVKAPKIVVTPPRTKTPKVIVTPPQKKTPKVIVTAPKPPRVVVPGNRPVPGAKTVKPGGLSIDELRKRLAKDLGVTPPVKVAVPPAGGGKKTPAIVIDRSKSQKQADQVTLRDIGKVVAAAGLVAGAVKVIDTTLTDDVVRRSSEEFDRKPLSSDITLDFSSANLGLILKHGDRVMTNTGDRMVISNDGVLRVLRNDDILLNRPGAQMTVMTYSDGSTLNILKYEDGSQVETVRAPDGRVLRRSAIGVDGTETVLFDDTVPGEQVVVNDLPERPASHLVAYHAGSDITEVLGSQSSVEAGRRFSLAQIRDIEAVRTLVPEINIDNIHFASGSAAIRPEEAEELAALGYAMLEAIALNPGEVFLIEGHTDAVGNAAYNMALSDRRAESVALALVEYFGVPPENLVLQGYGEGSLLIPTQTAEQANRRAAVRRITALLQGV